MATRRDGGSGIRVLVSAASAIRGAGLKSLLTEIPSVSVVGGMYGISNLLERIRELQPHLILADLERTDSQLVTAAKGLSEVGAVVAIIALIDHPDAAWAREALRAGVNAIMPRDIHPEELHWAIQAADAGLVLLDSSTAQAVVQDHRREPEVGLGVVEELTRREIEILRMMADGSGNKQIATDLGISEHTVKFHISSILDKLGASGRTEAVTLGIRRGLVLI